MMSPGADALSHVGGSVGVAPHSRFLAGCLAGVTPNFVRDPLRFLGPCIARARLDIDP